MSVLLENMFISKHDQIGSLEKPLSGLVLHFGQGGPSSRPSEAAWVGVSQLEGIKPPPVRVYVSHSSLNTMKAVYASLGDNVTVEPLFFDEAELDAESFLSMMAVGSSDSAPLYIQIILVGILRHICMVFALSVHHTVNFARAGREFHAFSLPEKSRRSQEVFQSQSTNWPGSTHVFIESIHERQQFDQMFNQPAFFCQPADYN